MNQLCSCGADLRARAENDQGCEDLHNPACNCNPSRSHQEWLELLPLFGKLGVGVRDFLRNRLGYPFSVSLTLNCRHRGIPANFSCAELVVGPSADAQEQDSQSLQSTQDI